MKPNFLNKITIIDILIIVCIIGAISFAIVHITTNDDGSSSTSFDSSTTNKLVEKYLNYYSEGFIITSKVVGTNASSGEKVTFNGTVKWVDEDSGANVKVLIENNGEKVLAGLYKDVPNADIYIDKITLETNGEKYQNLKEITISSDNISTLNDLVSGIPNGTYYELSTKIAIDSHQSQSYQELANELYKDKRISIKVAEVNPQDIINIVRATHNEINTGNNILGTINGQTDTITIRIYNCTDNQLQTIEHNYNVTNIENFTNS